MRFLVGWVKSSVKIAKVALLCTNLQQKLLGLFFKVYHHSTRFFAKFWISWKYCGDSLEKKTLDMLLKLHCFRIIKFFLQQCRINTRNSYCSIGTLDPNFLKSYRYTISTSVYYANSGSYYVKKKFGIFCSI